MKCSICDKHLRKDNKIGTCRAHRNVSPIRKAYMIQYAENNIQEIAQYKKQWNQDNKISINSRKAFRLHTDPQIKLAHSLRNRINRAIQSNFKAGSSVRDLGCTIEFFKEYIESLFTEGMNWNNHARYGWHLDHIIPLHTVDLTDREQFKLVCHYSNLRPLWWNENLSRNRIGSQE